MQGFVAWLAELAPLTVYLVIGLSTFFENIFPPTPSDVAVALGGFVTGRSGASAGLVWLVAWLANMAGTVGVYLAAKRFGRGFLGSRIGRKLLPADAIVAMEQEYLRFGIVGIFFSRFLPGFRVFVAPFVGLVGLPPLRAFLAMGIASALWYGLLTWTGVRLGANWEAIDAFLRHLNRTLGVVALLVAALVGWWLWRRRTAQGTRRKQMLSLLNRALGGSLEETPALPAGADLASEGAAALLFELTHADPALTLDERNAIAGFLRDRWEVRPPLRRTSVSGQPMISDTAELASIVSAKYDLASRIGLAERLYRIAMSDGTLSRHEERLMERTGDLLGLTPADLKAARDRVAP